MYRESIDDVIKYYAEGGEVSSSPFKDPYGGYKFDDLYNLYEADAARVNRAIGLPSSYKMSKEELQNEFKSTSAMSADFKNMLFQGAQGSKLPQDKFEGFTPEYLKSVAEKIYGVSGIDYDMPQQEFDRLFSNEVTRNTLLRRAKRDATPEAINQQRIFDQYYAPNFLALERDFDARQAAIQSEIDKAVAKNDPGLDPTIRGLNAQLERLDQEKANVMSSYNDVANAEIRALRNSLNDYTSIIQNDYTNRLNSLENSYINQYGDRFYSDPAIKNQFDEDSALIIRERNNKINTLYTPEFDLRQPDFEALRQTNLDTQLSNLAEQRRVEEAQAQAIAQLTPEQRRQQASGLSTTPFPDMSDMQPLLPPTTGLTPQQAQDIINRVVTDFSQATGRPVDEVTATNQDAINAAIENARRTDITPTAQAPTGGQPFPYQPLATPLSKAQADALATEFFAFSGIRNITDASGNPVPNPAQYLSGLIQQYGPQSVADYFGQQGVPLTGTAPKLAPEVADKVANKIIASLGPTYDPKTDPNFASVKLGLQNLGLEEGLAQFAKNNKVSVDSLKAALEPLGTSKPTVIYDADGTPIETSKALDIYEDLIAQSDALMSAYKDTKTKEFQSNIDAILAGTTTARPQIPTNITPEEAVRQAFTSVGKDPAANQQEFSAMVDYFTNVGIGPGLARFNEILSTVRPGQPLNLYGAPEVFNFGAASGAGTAPTYRPPSATQPTYTTPTYAYTPSTGAPPGAGLGAIYQSPGAIPAPYEARPLITQAERPTLDAGVQYIESTRPGAGPMPYMTSEQVGATPVQPASYADLFGYTPYTEYMGQSEYTTPMTANLYAAGYEANIPTQGMREGGSVAQEARGLAAMGRGGDSMLVHMAPEEVAGLRALAMREGTDLTINPETGLPEAKKLKRLFKQVILPAAAAYFGAPYLGGIGNAAMLYGAATAAKTGNLEKGIMAGLTAYGGATAAEGMFGASPFQPTPTAAPNVAPVAPSSGPSVGTSSGGVESGRVSGGYGDFTGVQAAALTPPPAAATSAQTAQVATKPSTFGQKFTETTGMSPATALIGTTMLAGLGEGEKERDMYERQQALMREEDERKRRLGMESFARATGPVDTRALYGAGGGLVALARGGMTYMEAGGTTGPTGQPRMVAGNGDGMSDSVPATIEGVQEARLANDEFVVPADVVADIGNGSSSAGAKKLYDMMARIREARHGTTEQPPEINAEQFMPA